MKAMNGSALTLENTSQINLTAEMFICSSHYLGNTNASDTPIPKM